MEKIILNCRHSIILNYEHATLSSEKLGINIPVGMITDAFITNEGISKFNLILGALSLAIGIFVLTSPTGFTIQTSDTIYIVLASLLIVTGGIMTPFSLLQPVLFKKVHIYTQETAYRIPLYYKQMKTARRLLDKMKLDGGLRGKV